MLPVLLVLAIGCFQAPDQLSLVLCRSSGPDTDMDESFEGGSPNADQSFTGGLSTTDFEGASLEVRLSLTCTQSWVRSSGRGWQISLA